MNRNFARYRNLLLALTCLTLLPLVAQAQPGGDRGGRGGFGGGRGGFDPSQFLDRLDRNGNGMLDMDEREGPAGFMISRMQREDPNLNVDKPIPIKQIKETFERMRQGRSGGDDRGRGGGGDDDSDDSASALEAQMLVPGFGIDEPLVPVPGFGSSAELFDVEIREEDTREAQERMRRYDRNKNGFLDADELSSRWEGNPMDFDRNRDGKLSPAELAVRYARRRQGSEDSQDSHRDSRDDRRRDRDRGDDDDPVDPYNGAKSFRNLGWPTSSDELPDLFRDKDRDNDRQVLMSEFADDWTQEKVEEFYRLDRNADGAITLAEFNADRSGDSTTASSDSSPAAARAGSSSGGSRGPAERTAASGGSREQNDKYTDYAKRIIARYDANKDDALQETEWKKMLMDPSPADANQDKKITTQEYTDYLLQKSKK